MKYDNYVGEFTGTFSESEIKLFTDHFAKEVGKFTNVKYKLSVVREACGVVRWEFTFPKIENIINSNNDKIVSISRLWFGIQKETDGYLDTWDWVNKGEPEDESYKDYKNAPEFQYDACFNTDGFIQPYKCPTVKYLRLPDSTQIGTEVKDINFEVALNALFNKMLK